MTVFDYGIVFVVGSIIVGFIIYVAIKLIEVTGEW